MIEPSWIEWHPNSLGPHRLHAVGLRGKALCGTVMRRSTARCALCTLTAHGHRNPPKPSLRQRIQRQCDNPEQSIPARLAALSAVDLDARRPAAVAAADTLDELNRLLADVHIEAECAAYLLRRNDNSTKASLAAEHLVDTLLALESAFTGHSAADAALRFG